jgi:hypothetical protein
MLRPRSRRSFELRSSEHEYASIIFRFATLRSFALFFAIRIHESAHCGRQAPSVTSTGGWLNTSTHTFTATDSTPPVLVFWRLCGRIPSVQVTFQDADVDCVEHGLYGHASRLEDAEDDGQRASSRWRRTSLSAWRRASADRHAAGFPRPSSIIDRSGGFAVSVPLLLSPACAPTPPLSLASFVCRSSSLRCSRLRSSPALPSSSVYSRAPQTPTLVNEGLHRLYLSH